MMDLSWDLTALLIVVGGIGLVIVMVSIGYGMGRSYKWWQARRRHRERYVHPRESPGYRDNYRILR